MQLQLIKNSYGGARQGAGRPRNKKSFVRHSRREKVKSTWPMHVTMKLSAGQPSLRTKKSFNEFKKAVIAAKDFGLRVLEFAVLGNHIHLLVEADGNAQLTSGMRSLTIRLVKNLKVKFCERYHLEVLKSPTRVQHTIGYILTNAAKHMRRNQVWDWYSSIVVCKTLRAWAQLKPELNWDRPKTVPSEFYEPMISEAQSWFAKIMRTSAA